MGAGAKVMLAIEVVVGAAKAVAVEAVAKTVGAVAGAVNRRLQVM